MRIGLITLTAAYVFSQFYRAFLAVLAPTLKQDIGVDAVILSQASGAWFLCFAAMQIPVGWALDRIGPRYTNAVLLAIGGAGGAFLFAGASAPWHIILAMGLIGVGCAPVLMASYYIIGRNYPAAQFALLAALVIGVGSLGNISAALPMSLLAEAVGWRMAMSVLGAATLVIAALSWRFVTDPPAPDGAQKGGLWDILKTPAIWFILPMVFVNYAPSAGMRGAWIGPYFADIHMRTDVQIGIFTLIMGAAMIAGNLFYGPLERALNARKILVLIGNLIGASLCMGLFFVGHLGPWLAIALMAGIGFFGSSFPVIVAHARQFFPPHLMGRGVTLINLFGIGGVGVMQFITGRVFDGVARHTDDAIAPFQAIFLLLGGMVFLGAAIYAFSRDRADV